jgi:competence protein ComEC
MLIAIACAFASGVWLLQQQPFLLRSDVLALFVLACVMVMLVARRACTRQRWLTSACCVILALLTGFSWANWRAEIRLADALPTELEDVELMIHGVVRGLPSSTSGIASTGWRFSFEIEQAAMPGDAMAERALQVPTLVSLGWYDKASADDTEPAPAPVPGERWQLLVKLRRPHGNANPFGFDAESWMLEQGLRATGAVRASEENRRMDAFVMSATSMVDRARYRIGQHIEHALPGAKYAQVMVALVVGDQRGIDADDWQVFTRTGVGHLISISGLHITMLAALAASSASLLWRFAVLSRTISGQAWGRRQWAAVAGMAAASIYTLLAGAAVPAQRTLWMLCVVAAASLWNHGSRMTHVLSLSLLVVIALDPWSVLAPGFWLSFVAVACLMYSDSQTADPPTQASIAGRIGAKWAGVISGLKSGARAQGAVTLGMLPVTLVFFQQVSLISPIANAIAIPVVSAVVTPAAILGGLTGTDLPLHLAHQLFAWLGAALQWMSAWSYAGMEWPAPSVTAVILSMMGLAWLGAPVGVPGRWAGLALLAPLLFTRHPPPSQNSFRATVFDAGQGMAVLVETAKHQMMYDTGPQYGDQADAASRVLVPHLRALGITRLDLLVVSHRDLDHAGGAKSLLALRKVDRILTSIEPGDRMLPRDVHFDRCVAGEHWSWDGVEFEILHPATQDYAHSASTNARSCVLRIGGSAGSMLLAGDIEAEQEQALLAREPGHKLHVSALLVPHHGSLTSSTPAFVEVVSPEIAIFQAGWKNRFGHPRAPVVARYEAVGSRLLRTADDGLLTLEFAPGNVQITQWREFHARYWQGK